MQDFTVVTFAGDDVCGNRVVGSSITLGAIANIRQPVVYRMTTELHDELQAI